jgi:hypothetical protein
MRIFGFNFFEIQNMCKMHFKIEGAYAPMFQNTTPVLLVLICNENERQIYHLEYYLLYCVLIAIFYRCILV